MTTQILVKPQGIVVEPNKVGQFTPGAAVKMRNVAIRSFGLMESVRKWQQLGTYASIPVKTSGGAYVKTDGRTTIFIKETTDGTFPWKILVYDGLTNTVTNLNLSSTYQSGYLSSNGRTGIVLFRNRLIIAGAKGSIVYDLFYDTGTAVITSNARKCGVEQPAVSNLNNIGTTGTSPEQYLPASQHFNHTVLTRMIHADGYELLSIPGFPGDYPNLSTTLARYGSYWYTYGPQISGEPKYTYKREFYRTRSQSVGYDSGANTYFPTSCGSSFYKCKTIENSAQFEGPTKETTLPNQLGEALYVNNAASGAAAIATTPPPAKCAAAFRGHVFYANKFDPATYNILTPYYWGSIFSAGVQRENGIGVRFYSSRTATSGSPNITLTAGLGVVPGQFIYVTQTATGTSVGSGTVIAFNTSTWVVTMSFNSNFSGTVDVEIDDVIELNGEQFSASYSVPDFVNLASARGVEFYSVGLEPQKSYDAGVYPAMGATGGVTLRRRSNDPITLRATNGQNFSTELPSLTSTALTINGKQQDNGFSWSENNQPEYVPPANYAFVGLGEIYQIISTRDALWFWCSDGLYRLSGSGGSVADGYDWVVDPIDPGLILSYVNAVCVHREYVYAFTNRGLVSVSSEGVVRELSDGRVNSSQLDSIVGLPNRPWKDTSVNSSLENVWLTADSRSDDVLLRSGITGTLGVVWAYNTKTDTFTTRFPSAMADVPIVCAYNSTSQALIGLDAATGNVFQSNGTGFEQWVVEFQPIFGSSAGKSAYTKKHWQDVNVSFKTPQSLTGVTMRMAFGPGSTPLAQSLESRTIPVVDRTANFNANFPNDARLGFTVPRVAPAIGNALTISFDIFGGQLSSGTASGEIDGLVLEGMEINFVDFSDERILR